MFQFSSWQSRLHFVLLALLYSSTLVLALSPTWRKGLQSFLHLDHRVLLSTVTGDLLADGSSIKILKFRTPEGVVLEFLGPMKDGIRSKIDEVSFPGHVDAFFDFGGEATRLAIVDLDGDSQLEIIAPTVDKGLSARLNAYKFSSSAGKFQPFQ